MAHTIGIDLGTTNSVVAFIEGDRTDTITNHEGSKLTPSAVYYKSDQEIIVGELAKRQLVLEPGRVVRSIKRIMGKRFEELGEAAEDLPYKAAALEDGMAGVELSDGSLLRPEEISADILERLRSTAEEFFGEDVTQAVITVPAHFNDQQRTATKAAAEMAGLDVQRIVNEPTAAALAYGVGANGADGIIAVFDFGGGTFDVSILRIANDIFEVLSTNGDNHLGGDDVDHVLYQEICDGILQTHGIDPTQDLKAAQRIREAAEKTKCELSSMRETTISLPFIVADSTGPKHFEMRLTRERFEEMIEPVLKRLIEPCKRALEDAHLTVKELNEVLLVGGSTRIPKVQEIVSKYFGREPNRSVNPDEAIAIGAAIQGGVISGALREVLLLDVTPLTLGIELAGGVFKELISRNSTIPCEASRKFTTVVDNQSTVVVHVLQGERKRAAENHSLAKFRLVGIPPAPKELPEIEVKFSIDANGILSVTALDLSTGTQTGVVVENYGEIGTRRDVVEKLVQAAEKHLDDDEKFIRFAEKRQRAERLQARANNLIAGLGDLVTEAHLRTLKESMFRLDLAMESMDDRAMTAQEEAITEIVELYENNEDLARVLARSLDAQRSGGTEEEGLKEGLITGRGNAVRQKGTSGVARTPDLADSEVESQDALDPEPDEKTSGEIEAPAFTGPEPPSHATIRRADLAPGRKPSSEPEPPREPTPPRRSKKEEPKPAPASAEPPTKMTERSAMYEVPTFDEDEDSGEFDPTKVPPPPPS